MLETTGIKCITLFVYLLYPLAMMLKLTDTCVLSGTGVRRRHSGSNLRLGARSSPLRVRVRYGMSLLPFKITGTCTTNTPGLPVEIWQKKLIREIPRIVHSKKDSACGTSGNKTNLILSTTICCITENIMMLSCIRTMPEWTSIND